MANAARESTPPERFGTLSVPRLRGDKRRRTLVLCALAVTALVMSVGGLAVPAAAKQQTPSKVACQYFTALFGSDAAGREKAVELAAPGSVAHAFAVHLTAYMAIQRAAGSAEQPNRARCSASKIATGKAPEKPKTTPVTFSIAALAGSVAYERFTTDANGQLVSFTVNGSSLDGRIVEGSAPAVEALGASIRVVSAYQ